MSNFKSYSSKKAALTGAKRAGLDGTSVYEIDGTFGFDVDAPLTSDQQAELTEMGFTSAEVVTNTSAARGRKVQKDRVTQHGVTRPSAGGKCAQVWDACDALVHANTVPTPDLLKAWAIGNGTNPNNAQIELYQWRKFNGITGRVKSPTVVNAAAE